MQVCIYVQLDVNLHDVIDVGWMPLQLVQLALEFQVMPLTGCNQSQHQLGRSSETSASYNVLV